MPQDWPYCSQLACRRTWRLGPCSPASRWYPRLEWGLQAAPRWPSSSQGHSWGGCRSQGPHSRWCPRSSSSSCRRSHRQPLQTPVSWAASSVCCSMLRSVPDIPCMGPSCRRQHAWLVPCTAWLDIAADSQEAGCLQAASACHDGMWAHPRRRRGQRPTVFRRAMGA